MKPIYMWTLVKDGRVITDSEGPLLWKMKREACDYYDHCRYGWKPVKVVVTEVGREK